MDELLGGLLRRAALGDREAFAHFYDLTVERVLTLELARARLSSGHGGGQHLIAERAAAARYLRAWSDAPHRTDDRSPLAWLLSLPVPSAVPDEVACA